jgi:hypothetical protein
MRLTKIVAIVCLALLLASAGGAWVLQHCPDLAEAAEHVHASESDSPAVRSIFEHRHEPLSRIHCAESPILKLSFGPASPTFRLEPAKGYGAKTMSAAALLNSDKAISSGTILNWTVWLSTTPRLPPHLFFSKLRI